VFDGVLVDLGARMDGPGGEPFYPVLKGLEPGEQVVTAGSFLIDAETRLNPAAGSIYLSARGTGIAPTPTVRPSTPEDQQSKVQIAMSKLDPADRELALAQKSCPILGSPLGSMGVPVKLMLTGQPVFVCCKGCVDQAQNDPATAVKKADTLRQNKAPTAVRPTTVASPEEARIRAKLSELPPDDRKLAETQLVCPITNERLGSMGVPLKLSLADKTVFICCKACKSEALADPKGTIEKLDAAKKRAPR
jgi:hypothetical protein